MKPKLKIYLAGPMRGQSMLNFATFNATTALLRGNGHTVFNPAEGDIKDGFDPATDKPHELSFYMQRDLPEVCRADVVAVLPGWEKSEGAQLEVAVARALRKPVLHADTLEPVSNEIRVTDPDTGGQKGSKLERFDLIPVEPLEMLARVYGRGALKYSPDNWTKGYSWRLSFAAMMRHLWAFWRREDNDQETGLPHLSHAAWHCFTLQWFALHKPEKDDRP